MAIYVILGLDVLNGISSLFLLCLGLAIIFGMKATHGLVPYTGVMPIESTIDHTGPMTANVSDNALLLEVLAGADGLDPRQYAPKVARYTEKLGEGVRGLKIGVLKEGFSAPNMPRTCSRWCRGTT